MKILSILLLSLALLNGAAHAQIRMRLPKSEHTPFVMGVTDKFTSIQLSEQRTLNIYLPDEYYKDTTKTYPVIYLLDGSADEDFIHIAGLVQFLTMIQVMPNTIVVGIANVDRKRDFTFPTKNKEDLKNVPTSGGSERFMSFIENDLQPYVQKNYRVDANTTIIGQSLGGLLATEILLKQPALFNNYIIVSPSLWWDDESLLANASALIKEHDYTGKKIYISVGTEGKQMQGDVNKLVTMLQKSDKKINVQYCPFPEETHLTILHRSVYKAFEVLNKK